MRTAILATIVALGVGSSACATKKFVRTQVGEVNSKVETLTTSVEETQQRTRANEENIKKVDAKTDQVGIWAKDAQTSADNAKTSATAAATRAEAAGVKAEEVEKRSARLLYEVVLSEDQGSFKFGDSGLPDEAKTRIDSLISQLKADPRGAYVEIEGHTDNVGDKGTNDRLGLQRAETVKRYLYETHQVPLHKINVISYGEEKPVAPNKDRAGRAQNRRVVIKILA
ncbi:MAG: OmpA family protein [Acidobacteria bacterium]|jgi:peptidoglycan-associated lipoprotein|nr:MAG: OmpA family protein [Acidobacteriota bacterium]